MALVGGAEEGVEREPAGDRQSRARAGWGQGEGSGDEGAASGWAGGGGDGRLGWAFAGSSTARLGRES